MTIEYVEGRRADSRLDNSCLPDITQNRSQREMVYTPEWIASYTPSLCIILKVYMEAYSGDGVTSTIRDANRNVVNTIYWNQSVFENYCRGVKTAIEVGWNNRLWLIPSRNWGLENGRAFRPNIKCSIRVDITYQEIDSHHLHVRCVNLLSATAQHRSFHRPSEHLIQIDSNDGIRTLAHEIGHHLGLGHVNQLACRNAGLQGNHNICYGIGTHQRSDLMGAGDRIDIWHAQIWTRKINTHTQNSSVIWRPVMNEPQPQLITRLTTRYN